jgi:hypothetical protein
LLFANATCTATAWGSARSFKMGLKFKVAPKTLFTELEVGAQMFCMQL